MRARRTILLTGMIALLGLGLAQSVGSLRASSWDLPKTDVDNTVVSSFFGALQAVQTACPQSLQDSLAAERALAACARLGDYFSGEVARAMVEMEFISSGRWVTSWQEDSGFGVVRQLSFNGSLFFVAMNEATRLAYVVRFE